MQTHGIIHSDLSSSGNWLLRVHVTDLNVTRDFRVRGDLHIGGLMLKIVEEIDVTKDWSDHALWWPNRNKWLTHTRSTLDQYRVSQETSLEFTPMHKVGRIQLPDLQIITASLNFSVPVFEATIEFCKEIGIRHQEELSFKRYIPPEILAKGFDAKEYQIHTFTISPGVDPYTTPLTAASLQATEQSKDAAFATLPKNAQVVGQRARSQILPTLTSHASSLNRSPAAPVPPASTPKMLPRGVSPHGTLNQNYNTLNNPGLPCITPSWESTLDLMELDQNLIFSPRRPPDGVLGGLLRPRNLPEKAALNAGWLDSSRSLLEQCIFENDLILLRFKFMTFFELNPKIDRIRINQLYEQAKFSVITDELECSEAQAYDFAGLQLQAELQTENQRNGVAEPEVDDVDLMLTELENLLDGSFVSKRAPDALGPDAELADYLLFCLPRKSGVANWRKAFFVLHGLSMHWYSSAQESRGPPMGRVYLRSAEVSMGADPGSPHDLTVRLLVPAPEGANEVALKFDSENRYARWLAACRLASRGKTMTDQNFLADVEEIQAGLVSQRRNIAIGNKSLEIRGRPHARATADSRDVNPDDYLPLRYSRNSGGSQQRIVDAQSKVAQLALLDARLQYVKQWQGLREYSLHYFVVRFRNSKQPELLVVTTNRMIRMGLNGEEPFTIWPFARMKKWHVNWEIRHIFIQMEDEDIEFTCLSADCKVLHEFIGGYIFMSTRSKDKNQQLDRALFHSLTSGWSANE